ncbi:MAG: hypothetical protein WA001_02850 [Patescibacteria group bacterium]
MKRGVFFDVYGLDLPDGEGGSEPFVVKDFRSGDVMKKPTEQVALFQHQYYEWNLMRKEVGQKFFPESYWIRSPEFSDDEAHGFYAEPGKSANTMGQFISTQLDRQLGDRYSSDDKKKGGFKNLMSAIGKRLRDEHAEKPFIGAILQERVNGVTLAEALKKYDPSDPASARLRQSIQELIRGLRRFHGDNPAAAFTWHGLESDNVVAETDTDGNLTGNVYILDANFTERPNETFRKKVLQKLESQVFDKLETAFGL